MDSPVSLKTLLVFFLVAASSIDLPAAKIPFYVGASPYNKTGKGIYLDYLDPETGTLDAPRLVADTPSPSFLAISPDRHFLYTTISWGGEGLDAFAIQSDYSLKRLNHVSWPGVSGGLHLSVDATGRWLLVASWGGTVATFRIKGDGSLGEPVSSAKFTGSGPAHYQDKAHPHSIYPDPSNRFAYVCDLGSDLVGVLKFDAETGALTPQLPYPRVAPGSGPRHLAFRPDGKFVYMNDQISHTVSVFSRDTTTGALTLVQTLTTIPPGTVPPKDANTSETLCDPSGRWIYVGNRGLNSIAVFAIQPDGRLAWMEDEPALVKDPVNFAIDPTHRWMVVAGQADTHIAVLRYDPATGKLSPSGQAPTEIAPGPCCVIFPTAKRAAPLP